MICIYCSSSSSVHICSLRNARCDTYAHYRNFSVSELQPIRCALTAPQSALAQVQWQLSDVTAQLAAERAERGRLAACLAALAGDLQRRDPAFGRLAAACAQLSAGAAAGSGGAPLPPPPSPPHSPGALPP